MRASRPPEVVAILLFNDVEVLDFAGPLEVFGVTAEYESPSPFRVLTATPDGRGIVARTGLRVLPDTSWAALADVSILVIPGGQGSRAVIAHPDQMTQVRRLAGSAVITLSVCTGARILACAGMLDGLTITTHHVAIAELRERVPSATVRTGVRFCDNGRIVTAAGVSAGMDAALHVVGRRLGTQVAARTARLMEYIPSPSIGSCNAGPASPGRPMH